MFRLDPQSVLHNAVMRTNMIESNLRKMLTEKRTDCRGFPGDDGVWRVGRVMTKGARLIVRARPGVKEAESVIRFAGTSVFEIMQIDHERGEVLLEACIDTDTWFRDKKRLQTAMWVRTDDPRFIFVREV